MDASVRDRLPRNRKKLKSAIPPEYASGLPRRRPPELPADYYQLKTAYRWNDITVKHARITSDRSMPPAAQSPRWASGPTPSRALLMRVRLPGAEENYSPNFSRLTRETEVMSIGCYRWGGSVWRFCDRSVFCICFPASLKVNTEKLFCKQVRQQSFERRYV